MYWRPGRYTSYNLYWLTWFCNTNKKPRTDHVTLTTYARNSNIHTRQRMYTLIFCFLFLLLPRWWHVNYSDDVTMSMIVQRQLLLDLSTLHSSKVCTDVTSLNLSVTFVHKCTHHVQPRIRPWIQKWTSWSSAYNRHKYTNEVYINIYTIVPRTRDLNTDMYEYDIVSE